MPRDRSVRRIICNDRVLLRNVNAQHLATLIGQALACVFIYSTVDPLDTRSMEHVMSCAAEAALDAYDHFIDQVGNF